MSRWLIVLLLLVVIPSSSQQMLWGVVAQELPYRVHISESLVPVIRNFVINGCGAPLEWDQSLGWHLPGVGYMKFQFFVALPAEGIYAVVQDYIGSTGSEIFRKPLLMRLNGTRWYAASYNPTPTPHGAAGSCWLLESAVSEFKYLVEMDANWPQIE